MCCLEEMSYYLQCGLIFLLAFFRFLFMWAGRGKGGISLRKQVEKEWDELGKAYPLHHYFFE